MSKKNINSTVALKELRTNLEEYVGRIDKGESFIVLRRSQPLFQIGPVQNAATDESEDGWHTVIDFTKIRKGGVPLSEVRAALHRIKSS